MRITKFTHSCVRIEQGQRALVLDPGIWSEHHALIGAEAVLLTHEHTDHVDAGRLAEMAVPVYAPDGADIPGLEFTPIRPGDVFDLAGFVVHAVGGRHAVAYAGQPDCANLGYVIDDCYHPGDSLYVPHMPVDTLLAPIQAAWLKTQEAIDFVNAIKPRQTFGIHEAQVNDRGLTSLNSWFALGTDADYQYLAPGETA